MQNQPRKKKLSQAKQFAQVERISAFGAVARIGPIGLWHYADAYASAASSIPEPDVPFEPVRYYLACHSIELSLKAFLSLHQVTMIELSENQYGHNLTLLLQVAQEKSLPDLVKLSDDQVAEIQKSTKYYNGKLFEYPAYGEALVGYPDLPNLVILIATAQLLADTLAQPCRESR